MGWEGISDHARPYLHLHPKLTDADRVWRLPGSSALQLCGLCFTPKRPGPRPSCAGVLEAGTGGLVQMPCGPAGVRAGMAGGQGWARSCGTRGPGRGARARGTHDGWAPGSWGYHSAHPPAHRT